VLEETHDASIPGSVVSQLRAIWIDWCVRHFTSALASEPSLRFEVPAVRQGSTPSLWGVGD
jgi:hypothetical protein